MKLLLDYAITARSGVLVGSTATTASVGIDKTTMRRMTKDQEKRGSPIIPASAIKGKVRNQCERLLLSFGYEICRAPRADTMCPNYVFKSPTPDGRCSVCVLFGSPGLFSRLLFSDAIARLQDREVRSDLAPHTTRIQAGVAISRNRRTAEDERLYFIERGIEGLSYVGRIEGDLSLDDAEKQAALLIVAIENLVALGGSKSRGAGWIDAKVSRLELGKQTFTTSEELQRLRGRIVTWRVSK